MGLRSLGEIFVNTTNPINSPKMDIHKSLIHEKLWDKLFTRTFGNDDIQFINRTLKIDALRLALDQYKGVANF